MDTDIHLAFGRVYLVPTEVLEFLVGCVGHNYLGIFFYPCQWIFGLNFSRGNLMA